MKANYNREIIDFYNHKISDQERRRSDQEKKEIEQVLAKLKESLQKEDKVLDLGCGNGARVQRVLAEKQIDYLGVDFSWKQLEQALSKNPSSDYLLADFRQYKNFPKPFKAILLKQVVQEIAKEELIPLFEKLLKLLDKDGLLFISFDQSRVLPGEPLLYQPHFNEIIELAEETGFKLNHLRYSKDEKAWALLLQCKSGTVL